MNGRPAIHRSYADISYWLATCGDDCSPRTPLDGDRVVDVAILGGGLSGLWTAYYLLENDPSLEIAIVEREICGFGASGRNGAWCSPRFPVEAHALNRRFGAPVARQIITAVEAIVVEIGERLTREGIDAEYRNTGILSLARNAAQMASLTKGLEAYQELGLATDARLLSARDAQARVRATRVHGGLHIAQGATIHPGKLVRGLARRLEEKGVLIFEQTPVLRIEQGARSGLTTATGRIAARRAVVAGGEAYLAALPAFRRAIMPLLSMIVLTEGGFKSEVRNCWIL